MHEAVKDWTRETLAKFWIRDYGGRVDMEGNWIAENGRVFTWELRGSKPQEEWAFAISFCLALAAIRKEPPMPLAEQLALKLTAEAPAGWSFIAANGYVNAYFSPLCLQDFLRRGFDITKDMPAVVDLDGYARYRLGMIRSALIARGIVPLPPEAPLSKDCLDRFSVLFLKPDTEDEWEKWCQFIRTMTSAGLLNHLTPDCEQALLTFVEGIHQI